MTVRPRLVRGAAAMAGVGLGLSAALFAASMALYPGGTWMDPTTEGHDFWRNFLCDLQQPTALNGAPNPLGARLGQLAMLALFAAWIPLFVVLPYAASMSFRRLAKVARALGLLAATLACAVPFFPSLQWGAFHAVPILAAAIPGLAALGVAIVALVRSPSTPRGVRLLSVGFGITAAVDAVYYAHHVVRGGPVSPGLPALQKAAWLLLVPWMLSIFWLSYRHVILCSRAKTG